MNFGIFEGIKKCFQGKDLITYHLFLIFYCALKEILTFATDTNLFISLFAIIVNFLITILFFIYVTLFSLNTATLFQKSKDTTNQEELKNFQIMPKLNLEIFKDLPQKVSFNTIKSTKNIDSKEICKILFEFIKKILVSTLKFVILSCVVILIINIIRFCLPSITIITSILKSIELYSIIIIFLGLIYECTPFITNFITSTSNQTEIQDK